MKYDLDRLKKNKKVRMRALDGKYYLFGNGVCFELNELGALTWKYIDEGMSTAEFCIKVGEKYSEKNVEKIENDIYEFIDFLRAKRMIETIE